MLRTCPGYRLAAMRAYAVSRSAFASIFFSAWETATKPKVAVTIVAAPKPDAQSIRFGPSAVLFIAHTLPSACG